LANYDVIIVGAGHNGLTCGAFLAKSGYRVLILERRHVVGGAAVTEDDLWPGYKISRASYLPQIEDKIVDDLDLKNFGYITGGVDPKDLHVFKNGKYLTMYGDPKKTAKEIEKFSKKDALAFLKFHGMAKMFGEAMGPLLLAPPPALTDIVSIISGSEFEEIIRNFLLMGSAQLVNELFESEELKVVLCQLSIGNTAMSPTEAGTAYLLALGTGSEGHTYAVGGSGAASFALARACQHYGANIQLNSTVKRILIDNNERVKGIELSNGKKVEAPVVVSNADPKTTVLKMIEPDVLGTEFTEKVRKLRNDGGQTKVNATLKKLPEMKCFADQNVVDPHLLGQTTFSESVSDLVKSSYQCSVGEIPDNPPIYNFMQTVWDTSVAPPGHHTISSIIRFTPYTLRKGSWKDRIDELKDKYTSMWQEYSTNFEPSIEHIEVLSPWHNEQLLNIDQGHVSHLEQCLYQMLGFRPLLGYSNYRLPGKGLYLCGAGTHPGGGVHGACGHNAAMVILEDFEEGLISRAGS